MEEVVNIFVGLFQSKKNIQLKTISLILPPIKMMRTFYEKRNNK